MQVVIIYGGTSSEHEVSCRSATSVLKNLGCDDKVSLIGISKKTGKWYAQDTSFVTQILCSEDAMLSVQEDEDSLVSVAPGVGHEVFRTKNRVLDCDVVFPVLHGSYGEDGCIQGLFEVVGVPYVGPGVLASALAMDKERAKILWKVAGLPVVPYLSVRNSEWKNVDIREGIIQRCQTEFGYPMFVKPAAAGSSVGAAKVSSKEELIASCDVAFCHGTKILIEKFMQAREIECSVTGYDVAKVYTAGEIIASHDFYDYEAKYLDANGAALKIPADLDVATYKKVREIAGRAYQVLELTSLSRVDLFIDKKTGDVYLNEVNTIPGFTSISMFPKLCEAAGLQYKELIRLLLDEAIAHFRKYRLNTDWK